MERYLSIWNVNLKYNMFTHIIITILLSLISPFIIGLENLDQYQTAKVLELFVGLFGIILFIPVFIPDQNRNIRDLIESKKEDISLLHIVRFLQAMLCLGAIVSIFLFYLKAEQCSFEFSKYFFGTIANCLFLGGMGMFFFSIFDNLVIAYMVPILYYIMNYGAGGKYLGKFYLFSMMNGSILNKYYLLVCGLVLIVISIMYRKISFRWR